MEAWGLGVFMVAAAAIGTLLEYPGSPVNEAIAAPFLRRAIMGLGMGLTAMAIIYSPWGKRSGAHINPAVTLTFYRLGKIAPADAAFYVTAQFVGGTLGVVGTWLVLRSSLADPPVRYVATLPFAGIGPAFLVEVAMCFVLMMVILLATNHRRWNAHTGLLAGLLLLIYITLAAPISGMSLNPARSFASAFPGGVWDGLWIYFVAPILGMLLAAEVYGHWGRGRVACAKLHHMNDTRCIFRCGFGQVLGRRAATCSVDEENDHE